MIIQIVSKTLLIGFFKYSLLSKESACMSSKATSLTWNLLTRCSNSKRILEPQSKASFISQLRKMQINLLSCHSTTTRTMWWGQLISSRPCKNILSAQSFCFHRQQLSMESKTIAHKTLIASQ